MAKKRFKNKSQNPHKSFRRSYREDYVRDLNVPGMGEQIVRSFQMIFKNYKLFLPLIVLGVAVYALTGGVAGVFNETAGVFAVVVGLTLWLTTIFLVRQKMAKNKVNLRDGLYNAMTPLIATFVVFAVVAAQCIPIALLVIADAAAIQTGFLNTPFYALLFLGFAALMITLSGYLLSSSLIALVAVTAPGLYPFRALVMASELMMGRRIRFILRIIALGLVLAMIWAVILLPLAMWKLPEVVLAVAATTLACFSVVYTAIYLYIYYRYLLEA